MKSDKREPQKFLKKGSKPGLENTNEGAAQVKSNAMSASVERLSCQPPEIGTFAKAADDHMKPFQPCETGDAPPGGAYDQRAWPSTADPLPPEFVSQGEACRLFGVSSQELDRLLGLTEPLGNSVGPENPITSEN